MSLENFVEDDNQDIEIDDESSNKSVPENIKGSDVWNYFTKDADFRENKKTRCDLCGVIYICTGGSTTNMHNHIKNKHPKRTSQEISIKNAFNVVPKVNIL